jgi:hypothetical protein
MTPSMSLRSDIAGIVLVEGHRQFRLRAKVHDVANDFLDDQPA